MGRKPPRKDYAVTVRLVRKPDQRKVRFSKMGKTTDLGICQFLNSLFEANEKLPAPQKMTDETMKAAVVAEYPDSKQVQRLKRGELTIGFWRALYNYGHFQGKVRPEIQSKRYAFDGSVSDHFGRSLKEKKKKKNINLVRRRNAVRRRKKKRLEKAAAIREARKQKLEDEKHFECMRRMVMDGYIEICLEALNLMTNQRRAERLTQQQEKRRLDEINNCTNTGIAERGRLYRAKRRKV